MKKSHPDFLCLIGYFTSNNWYDSSMGMDQYLLNPVNTIFRGMNIHLPAILM